MHLHRQHPNSSVAVFPSDHFILQEDLFAACVQQAFETVEASPEKIVFLGAAPNEPEPEYGYILPELTISGVPNLSIDSFVEEPQPHVADQMIARGALWNTMIIIFKLGTFLALIERCTPKLFNTFRRIGQSIGTPCESSTVAQSYREMKPLDLCKDLIPLLNSHSRGQLVVIPMKGIFWSDWGCADRIFSVLEKLDYLGRILSAPLRDQEDQVAS
jgi:mannose-1-phosphate guanylyltransferase